MSDVIIVGGAAMGVATAHHLVRLDPRCSVTVVERDPSLARASTTLSDGNVRVQFGLRENIEMSLYGMEVLDTFADDLEVDGIRPEVSTDRQGNLFLTAAADVGEAKAAIERQAELGADVVWMDSAEIEARWPAYRSDLAGGSFGPRDGSVDPSTVVAGYRRSAARAGVVFEQVEVDALALDGDRVGGVIVGDGSVRSASVVVVCAGAWSTGLLATIGVGIPVDPVMRTVYVVKTDVGVGLRLPSVFLPSGAYVIPEHDDTYLVGWSRPEDPVGFDFTPSHRSRFYDVLWPELISHLPELDRLEVVRAWAGLYAQNVLDSNAIVGEWPLIDGLYQATGFSGHGFQHCHAVGRHLAELITGRPPSLDLSRLSPARILSGEPVHEHAGRII